MSERQEFVPAEAKRAATRINAALDLLGDAIEDANEAGCQVRLTIHTEAGESFEFHRLTGEFDHSVFYAIEVQP